MSFSDLIRACNNYDPARVVPLTAGNERLGVVTTQQPDPLVPGGQRHNARWIVVVARADVVAERPRGLVLLLTRGVLLGDRHDLDKGDLSETGCHVIDGLAAKPAHLYVDLQPRPIAARGRALPKGRHETPFGKKLEDPWHHPGFGTGINGKAGGGRKVIISD